MLRSTVAGSGIIFAGAWFKMEEGCHPYSAQANYRTTGQPGSQVVRFTIKTPVLFAAEVKGVDTPLLMQ